jgi:hypothetical protein
MLRAPFKGGHCEYQHIGCGIANGPRISVLLLYITDGLFLQGSGQKCLRRGLADINKRARTPRLHFEVSLLVYSLEKEPVDRCTAEHVQSD